jgi:hypothetical protein
MRHKEICTSRFVTFNRVAVRSLVLPTLPFGSTCSHDRSCRLVLLLNPFLISFRYVAWHWFQRDSSFHVRYPVFCGSGPFVGVCWFWRWVNVYGHLLHAVVSRLISVNVVAPFNWACEFIKFRSNLRSILIPYLSEWQSSLVSYGLCL